MDKRMGANPITTLSRKTIFGVFIVGIVFIIVIVVLGLIYLNLAPAFDLILLAVLIVVTMFYVYYTMKIADATRIQAEITRQQAEATRQQADASVKMAEEMREQRYEAVRPVIDFQWQNFKEVTDDGQGGIVRESYREVPPELYCNLCNIGVGPAIDLYSFTKNGEDNHHKFDFGTLKAGGQTRVVPLSVVEKGSIGVLEACYKDIYGRVFKSKLEVYLVTGQGLSATLRVEKVQELKKNDS